MLEKFSGKPIFHLKYYSHQLVSGKINITDNMQASRYICKVLKCNWKKKQEVNSGKKIPELKTSPDVQKLRKDPGVGAM